METKPNYDIVLSQESLDKIISYKNDLIAEKLAPGCYLKNILDANKSTLKQISTERFVEYLLLTKKPLLFATHGYKGGGVDWNEAEFQILGDINIAMNVNIYDNGVWVKKHPNFRVHNRPLNGALLFTPGPVLRSKKKTEINPDMKEVISGNAIDQEHYNRLIERRLMPLFYYANENAKLDEKQAFITIPGIGCVYFTLFFMWCIVFAHKSLFLMSLPSLSQMRSICWPIPWENGRTFESSAAVHFEEACQKLQ